MDKLPTALARLARRGAPTTAIRPSRGWIATMNVLLYAGDGTSADWLEGTRATLRLVLGAHYDILPVTAAQLKTAPWPDSTACLVVPGGRDLPYVRDLGGTANARIRSYVEAGGRYLGLCAGAYFASARCEFEVGTALEVVGDRELAFFPGTARGAAWPGFQYNSEAGARNARLALESASAWAASWPGGQAEVPREAYACWNGGCWFVDADGKAGVTVLARYAELPERPAAAVLCDVDRGKALLWGAHPERPLLPPSHPAQPAPLDDLAARDVEQATMFATSLALLGLRVTMPGATAARPPAIEPQQLVARDAALLDRTKKALAMACEGGVLGKLDDAADRYRFLSTSNAWPEGDAAADDRLVVVHDRLERLPALTDARFDVHAYLDQLSPSTALGSLVFYSPVVSSTQSLLDRNPRFLAALPSGAISIAAQQVAGRGRGGNSWVSPLGCLIFSTVVRCPAAMASKVVFAQYLFGLAVVEAVRGLVPELPVRLKWPNDIYADLGADKPRAERYKKLGGVLVNSSWSGGEFTLVIGCGLNTLNSAPTTCVRDLAATDSAQSQITLERVLAAIMDRFSTMWDDFLAHGSFDPFMSRYVQAWIHSDQIITIEEPERRVRIVGITPDYGLLRTEPVDAGVPGFIDLQPDGNSFDMLAGLVKRKQ